MAQTLRSRLKRNRVYETARHWRGLLSDADYRRSDRAARAAYRMLLAQRGGLGLQADLRPRGTKLRTALIVRNISLPYAPIEAFIMKALQMAGFETVVLGKRSYDFLRYDWLVGNRTGFLLDDFAAPGDARWIDERIEQLRSLDDWLKLSYQDVHVGRFVMASALRGLKLGQLDFADPAIRRNLRWRLETSVSNAQAAAALLDQVRPDCVVFLDRGYLGQGELCDLAIGRAIDTVTWSPGYKSNRLVFKRYNAGNDREHPLTPSRSTWAQLQAMEWDREAGQRIRQELFDCYQSQDWFSVVGTQFDKEIASRNATRHRLGLAADKKVAVIFPHILWDGSFFFGEDLFADYTEWLVETVREAARNDRVQWVLKLHPAHLTKARQENDARRPMEIEVLEQAFGPLPAHIKLVAPDTDLSTYSLFEVADCVVTVRGTVGIEAALFGIPVLTAGTGRYDRRGFTHDSSSVDEYRQKLREADRLPRLGAEQIELAERYAYGLFFCRPLRLASISLEYARDGAATPEVTVHHRTRSEWLAAADMQALAQWLADGRTEDMFMPP